MNSEVVSPVTSTRSLDLCAAGLSFLCLLHCVALPFLAVLLPATAALAEAEWVHRVLVLMAAPISFFVLSRTTAEQGRATFAVLALTGLALLFSGAFVEALEAHEQWITVVGASLVGGAHLNHWFRQRQSDQARRSPARA
ncbi:MAG: MerC domain-containing protein [Pseudomonadota bacterium]